MTEAATREATTFPAAELDRRFYAFAIDRLVSWGIYAGAGYAAFYFLIDRDRLGLGIAAIVATVLLVGLVFAMLLGTAGVSPGKALVGLRVVGDSDGRPIGIGRALLRTLLLGAAALPTFGLGVATLAWTAVMDPSGRRRGGHDRLAHSAVVDVRPVPEDADEEEERPRQIVNLTAMRLLPAPKAPEVVAPARASRPPGSAGDRRGASAAPAAAATGDAAADGATPPSAGPPHPTPPPPAPTTPAPTARQHAPPPPPPVIARGGPPPQQAPPPGPRTNPATSRPSGASCARSTGPTTSPVSVPAQAPPPAPQPATPNTPATPATPATPNTPATPAARHAAYSEPKSPAPLSAESTPPRPEGQRKKRAKEESAAPEIIRWRVAFDTGEAFVVEGLALVGRRPEARAGEAVRHLVPLRSSDMSLSKTHAQFQVVPDGALVVMDRGSTNGSVLIRKGMSKALTQGRPATLLDGDIVRFGDRTMTVARES